MFYNQTGLEAAAAVLFGRFKRDLAPVIIYQACWIEVYGLIEVIEKAAMIYSEIGAQAEKILQEITDVQLQKLRNTSK